MVVFPDSRYIYLAKNYFVQFSVEIKIDALSLSWTKFAQSLLSDRSNQ